MSGALFGLLHAFFSITLRADQIVGGTAINLIALGLTTYLFIKIYGTEGTPTGISSIPNVTIGFLDEVPVLGNFLDDVFGQLNLMIWVGFLLVVAVWIVVFKTPIGLRIRSVGEHPARGGHGRDQRVRGSLRRGHSLRRARGRRRRVPLARLRARRSTRT